MAIGSITARMLDELGYDPREPDISTVESITSGRVDLPPSTILPARTEAGEAVAVARLGSGRLVVVADRCPHDGGRISDGFVEGERIVCARHAWELEVSSAGQLCRYRSPPARGRARTHSLTSCKLRE